jgi:hypothetical protein
MNKEWSDDEDDNEVEELVQPSRDFPISDNDEEEEEEYDMYELSRMTINKQQDDFFQINKISNKISNKPSEKTEPKKNKKINIVLIKNENKNQKRKFNPRLPPPKKRI